jgi:hypothetical protein
MAKLKCRSCGCTDDRACPGGCSWVSLNPPICSACVDEALPAGIGSAALLDDDGSLSGDLCPASAAPAPHKPIFLSNTDGYCAACRRPFFAAEAA